MAKPSRVTVTGVAASAAIPVDYQCSAPFNIGLFVDVGAGCTYTIQFTCDDLASAPTTWYSHPDATSLTVDCAVQLVAPVTAVRLNQTVGAAASVFTVIQQGIQ